MNWISRKEAAERLGISLPTLKKRTDENQYKTKKEGNKLFYCLDAEEEKNEVLGVVKAVPTLSEIMEQNNTPEELKAINAQKELIALLNHEPPKEWLKPLPGSKRKGPDGKESEAVYLPIERIEYLLSRIFVRWWVEIKFPPSVIGNSISVTVRLFVINPINGKIEYNDGTGAEQVEGNNTVKLVAPMAETYAIKDAAEKFGKIFGKDINRNEVLDYSTIVEKKGGPIKGEEKKQREINRLKKLVEKAKTKEDLTKLKPSVMGSNDPELIKLFAEKIA